MVTMIWGIPHDRDLRDDAKASFNMQNKRFINSKAAAVAISEDPIGERLPRERTKERHAAHTLADFGFQTHNVFDLVTDLRELNGKVPDKEFDP
eukprot:jgi/Tetstr1/458009/TSEL_044518.t1